MSSVLPIRGGETGIKQGEAELELNILCTQDSPYSGERSCPRGPLCRSLRNVAFRGPLLCSIHEQAPCNLHVRSTLSFEKNAGLTFESEHAYSLIRPKDIFHTCLHSEVTYKCFLNSILYQREPLIGINFCKLRSAALRICD